MCGFCVGEEVPALGDFSYPSAPFSAMLFLPLCHAYAGISRWEEEDPLPARFCLCAGENPSPALTIDEEHGHFKIAP